MTESTPVRCIARYLVDGIARHGRVDGDGFVRWTAAPWEGGRETGRRQAIEHELLRLLERGVAGQPPHRRHEARRLHGHLRIHALGIDVVPRRWAEATPTADAPSLLVPADARAKGPRLVDYVVVKRAR